MMWELAVFAVLAPLIVAVWVKAYRLREEAPDAFTVACFAYSCLATVGPLALFLFLLSPVMWP